MSAVSYREASGAAAYNPPELTRLGDWSLKGMRTKLAVPLSGSSAAPCPPRPGPKQGPNLKTGGKALASNERDGEGGIRTHVSVALHR
jgi:hypothetical protein